MVKITEKQILQQQNEQYKNHLADILYKPFLITFQNIYNSVVENTTNDRIILKIFQKKLSKIPNWNRERIFKIYNTMITVKCDYFEKLLNKVYQKTIKILLLDIPKEKKNRIKISIPSAEVFIHTCLVYIARELWKRPFLLYHLTTSIERQKNLYEIENIITNKIFTVITDSLPIDLILENQKEENFDESEEESEEEQEEQEEVSSEESDEDNTEETEKEIEEESEEESEDTEKEIEEESESESESESEDESEDESEETKKVIEKDSEEESEDSSEEDINSQYQMIQEMELSNNKEIENTVVEENNNLTNDTIIEEEQVSVEPIIEETVSKESSNGELIVETPIIEEHISAGELIIEEVPIIEETSISKQEDNEENTDIEQQVIDIIETDIDSKEEINYQEEKEDKEEKKEKSYRINNTADIIEKIRLHKKKKNKKIKDAFF